MSNEIIVTVVEAAPSTKRTLNESSNDRLNYEMNELAKKEARLATLKLGTPAYSRCVESIKKTSALIIKIEEKMNVRIAKALAKAPANDVVAELASNVA